MTYSFPIPLRMFIAAAPPDAQPLASSMSLSHWSCVVLPMDDDGTYELRVYAAESGSPDHVSVHEATHYDSRPDDQVGWHTTLLDSYLTIGQALRLCHEYRKENDRRTSPLPL